MTKCEYSNFMFGTGSGLQFLQYLLVCWCMMFGHVLSTQGLSRTELYVELMRSSMMLIVNVVGRSNELKCAAFTFLKASLSLSLSLSLTPTPVWARERCRISPPRFLAECCKRQLNQGSFVLLYFRLFTFSDLY